MAVVVLVSFGPVSVCVLLTVVVWVGGAALEVEVRVVAAVPCWLVVDELEEDFGDRVVLVVTEVRLAVVDGVLLVVSDCERLLAALLTALGAAPRDQDRASNQERRGPWSPRLTAPWPEPHSATPRSPGTAARISIFTLHGVIAGAGLQERSHRLNAQLARRAIEMTGRPRAILRARVGLFFANAESVRSRVREAAGGDGIQAS